MRRAVLSLMMVLAGAAPALAFDCAKAARDDEKAICADPKLKAADAAMDAAYKAVRSKLNTADIKALVTSQRLWLSQRQDCGGDAECLLYRTETRTKELTPQPESGPGGVELVPFFIAKPGDRTHWEVMVSGFHLAEPQSVMFESYIGEVQSEAERAPLSEEDVIPDREPYMFQQTLTATYASPRFLSVSSAVYEYSGGAHGNYGGTSRHFDLQVDAEVDYADIFAEGAETAIVPECRRLLKMQRSERLGEEVQEDDGIWNLRESVLKAVADLRNWTFSADSAAIYFPPYEVGSYAEGEYECRMPLAFLKPLLKPGNPWVP